MPGGFATTADAFKQFIAQSGLAERIQKELFSHVLEEVLLSPALEHAVGDLDVAQVPSTGDYLRLMAVVAQACDLP